MQISATQARLVTAVSFASLAAPYLPVPFLRAIAPPSRTRRPVLTRAPLFERLSAVLADSIQTIEIRGVRDPPASFHARVYSVYGVGDCDEDSDHQSLN